MICGRCGKEKRAYVEIELRPQARRDMTFTYDICAGCWLDDVDPIFDKLAPREMIEVSK